MFLECLQQRIHVPHRLRITDVHGRHWEIRKSRKMNRTQMTNKHSWKLDQVTFVFLGCLQQEYYSIMARRDMFAIHETFRLVWRKLICISLVGTCGEIVCTRTCLVKNIHLLFSYWNFEENNNNNNNLCSKRINYSYIQCIYKYTFFFFYWNTLLFNHFHWNDTP